MDYDEPEISSRLNLSRGDLREHMNVIRGAAVKRLFDEGLDRHQVAVSLGITENEVALYERTAR